MKSAILIAFFLLGSITVVAQENKPQDPKPATPTTETEKPKNEVDQMIEDAANRGETIYGACVVEDCGGDPQTANTSIEGRALQLPKPDYPRLARMAHASGTVDVKIIINEEGRVIAAAAIEGHPLLFGASVAAARDTVFTPMKYEGKPVKVVGALKYHFVAQ